MGSYGGLITVDFLPTKLTHYFLVRAGVRSARSILTSITEIVLPLHPVQFLNRVKICSFVNKIWICSAINRRQMKLI